MIHNYCHFAKTVAIAFANRLLDERGNLIDLGEVECPKIFFEGVYDSSDIEEHIARVLNRLKTDRELRSILQGFSSFSVDPQIGEMVRVVLGVEGPIQEREIKWAALSALLTPLRQSVGSCFATAPAILIHEEQPHQFLKDLRDLLATGRLSRVFGGVEYQVPMSPSPGLGDLKRPYDPDHPACKKLRLPEAKKGTSSFIEWIEVEVEPLSQQRVKWEFVAYSDHLLLKIWEFTIASFVDVKTEFSKWNLYSSLGLHPEEKDGIGELVYSYLEEQLKEANEELAKQQIEYEVAFDQVRTTEALMHNISSEQEGRRLKGEHMARVFHLQACERARNDAAETTRRISEFFSFMIEKIVHQFEEHFQEVYDAEMQEVEATPYDDAPAGFRLLYKHGRSHVSSWTFIRDRKGYIQALRDFFIAIEHPLIHECEWERGKEEISRIVTEAIHHVQSEDFLISAFYRMARAHRVPLQKIALEKMEKKPWVYTSGGTMPTLIKTYFKREGSLSEEARWVDSAQDLCVFLLDTLKLLSPRILDPFLKDPKKRMLATSPTHAFSLLPGEPLFAEGWQDRGFSYTWVRDRIILPRREFYQKILLKESEQLYIVQKLTKLLPPHRAHQLQSEFHPSESPQSLPLFRKKLPEVSGIDAFLFEMLPLISPERAEQVIDGLKSNAPLPRLPLGRRELHDLVARGNHDTVASFFEDRGIAPPKLFRFGDTNWEKFFFSFVVSPFTGKLELWRTDKLGLTGAPMREWQPLLNGSIRKSWGVFLRPYEYVS